MSTSAAGGGPGRGSDFRFRVGRPRGARQPQTARGRLGSRPRHGFSAAGAPRRSRRRRAAGAPRQQPLSRGATQNHLPPWAAPYPMQSVQPVPSKASVVMGVAAGGE